MYLHNSKFFQMMNMFRGRSASSATAEDKRRLQAKVGSTALFKHLIVRSKHFRELKTT